MQATRSMIPSMKTKTHFFSFLLLTGILVPLELFCASLAYETIGEITSRLYFLGIIPLNLLFIALFFRFQKTAMLGVVALALIIIPYQLLLGTRLLRIQAETVRIVAYVYEEKEKTGAYPVDLSAYTFQDAHIQPFIQGYRLDPLKEHFIVYFRVGTDTTSHWYSSETGWGYYPD